LHNIIKSTDGDHLDLDSIPVLELNFDPPSAIHEREVDEQNAQQKNTAARRRFDIVPDETLGAEEDPNDLSKVNERSHKGNKSLLNIDSSGLQWLNLEETGQGGKLDIEQRQEEERALKEVERLRLEMQRASERIQAREASVIKKKKKSKSALEAGPDGLSKHFEGETIRKKKKKEAKTLDTEEVTKEVTEAKPRKKKRRAVDLTTGAVEDGI